MARIGVGNSFLSGEEFAQELERETAADLCSVSGLARKSDSGNGSEILFTQDPRVGAWTKIPVKMIESAEVLGRITIGVEVCFQVRLHLKTSAHPEAAVFAQLLGQRASAMSQGAGATQLGNDGVLPLKANDGVLPLRLAVSGNDGVLPLRLVLSGNDGVLPLRLSVSGNDGVLPLRLVLSGGNGGTLPLVVDPGVLEGLLNGISGTLGGGSPGGG